MSTPDNDDFFIGWSPKMPKTDRRFLLGAGLGLVGLGAGLGAMLAGQQSNPGFGSWNQSDVRDWSGLLVQDPYPMLRMRTPDGQLRTAYLATSGKTSLAGRLPKITGQVSVRASAIENGGNLMLAVVDGQDWIKPHQTKLDVPMVVLRDMGEVFLVGEILDAKCWFGAMRPGFGKTHKSCASLCARGGLPLAFCAAPECGKSPKAPLFLDEKGHAHGAAIIPYLADPVAISGRLVEVGDILQFRAALASIRRI